MLKDTQFIFFGSPRFAQIVLNRLIEDGISPYAVVCNPDRPVGRKHIITPPPVKQLILDKKIPVKILQPENKPDIIAMLSTKEYSNVKYAIVAAYSKILDKEVIDKFPLGIIGVHPSLLPKFRGASPIQSAIISGDPETGTTLFIIDEKMDHGSILDQERMDISDSGWNYERLEEALANSSANALIRTLPLYVEGKVTPKPQDESLATITRKFVTEDGLVDLKSDEPIGVYRKIMALNPDPGAYSIINGKRVKLLDAKINGTEITVTKIQPEGKMPQTAALKLPLF